MECIFQAQVTFSKTSGIVGSHPAMNSLAFWAANGLVTQKMMNPYTPGHCLPEGTMINEQCPIHHGAGPVIPTIPSCERDRAVINGLLGFPHQPSSCSSKSLTASNLAIKWTENNVFFVLAEYPPPVMHLCLKVTGPVLGQLTSA